jgi:cysteine desulfurase
MGPMRHIDEPATYFDAATAAPLHPAAREAMIAALADGWADPGKLYSRARQARQLFDAARAVIAETLAVRAEELTFCPSGSEACRRAIAGLVRGRARSGRTVVHSAVEHSAVLKAITDGVEVGVDRLGRVDIAAFGEAVAADGVAAAALMSANHEVGTVQPVAQAAAACRAAGVPLLVDAAQSVGRVPVPEGW